MWGSVLSEVSGVPRGRRLLYSLIHLFRFMFHSGPSTARFVYFVLNT